MMKDWMVAGDWTVVLSVPGQADLARRYPMGDGKP